MIGMDMSRKRSKTVNVAVGEEAIAALEAIAAERTARTGKKVFVADLVREAVQSLLQREGKPVSVEVDRGGWRGK